MKQKVEIKKTRIKYFLKVLFIFTNLILILLLLVAFCYSQNLIQNESFEDTTLSGWANQYCGMFSFRDAPVGGGTFCIKAPYANFQGCGPNYIYQVIPNVQSGKIYELSAWTKNEGALPVFGSCIKLAKKTLSGNIVNMNKSNTTSKNIWTRLVVQDTFFLDIGDSAVIIMETATVTGPGWGNTYFDSVFLKKKNANVGIK